MHVQFLYNSEQVVSFAHQQLGVSSPLFVDVSHHCHVVYQKQHRLVLERVATR